MSPQLTAKTASYIKWYEANTNLLQHEIAARLNINQGRVSEVLAGKRFPDALPMKP